VIDVLVAGGGPVGLATAIGCALAGLSVTVAEPRDGPVDKACGEGVMPAGVRRLAALGVTPDGYPLRGIRYTDGRRQADARFSGGDGRGVRRTVLHAALAGRAAALGIPVLPVRVTGFEQHGGHVAVAGVEARYLVAADGLHSGIRRALEEGTAAGAHGPGRTAAGRGHGVARQSGPVPESGAREPAPRYGLRRHYRVAPWTDLVEVHWSRRAEVYVTPVADDVVGIGLLFARPDRAGEAGRPGAAHHPDGEGRAAAGSAGADPAAPASMAGDAFAARLADFPALLARLDGAAPASAARGAGPMRQRVRRRVYGRVLLAGDASGYLDALTGEGIGVGLAQAEALVRCLADDRPDDYERAWRRVSGPAWRLTAGLLWSRNQPLLGRRIVPAASHLPWVFSALVNHAAQA
jgi:flavin-dependent dehydrogenase